MFEPRSVSGRGIWRLNGWAIKVYCVTARAKSAPARLVQASQRLSSTILPEADAGCGFIVIHQARPACFVALHWWATPVDLYQRYFRAEHESSDRLVEDDSPSIGCVWELAIVAHERDAWVRHVLSVTDHDHDAYLRAWLRGTTESRPVSHLHPRASR